MATQFFSEELVYSKGIQSHGNYKYLRIVPIGSSGQNPQLSLTSTTQTQFELPNNVINLSLCKLCFDLPFVLQTTPAKFNNIYANALSMIDRITLTSRSGVVLADIPNTHIFGSLVSNVNTKYTDLLSRNPGSSILPAGATSNNSAGENATTLSGAIAVSQMNPVNDIVRCNGTVNYQTSAAGVTATAVTALAYTPIVEPLVLFTAPAVAQANCISYQINLSAFKDTLMELNKNIYFGDNLLLTITWNAAIKMGFTTSALVAANTLTTPLPFSIAPTLNNLFIYTACETDPTVISQLVSSVNGGEFSMIVPFLHHQKYVTGVSTTSSMQQRINSSYGSSLLRTYFGIYPSTETDLTTYTHNDSFVVSYNTYMDGLKLQDFTLQSSDATHWLSNERNFKGSCMLSLPQYKSNFVHIDNWCGSSICNTDDSILNGLDLDSDRTWSVIVYTNAVASSYRFYLFYTTQKRLVISKGTLALV